MAELERITWVKPAHDCIRVQPCVKGVAACIPDTGGSHGINNAELYMMLRGPDAEVTLVVGTGWYLPVTPRIEPGSGGVPMGYYVEFHTARPQSEGHEGRIPQKGDSCYGWGACYMNTGFLMSDEPTALLVEKGSDAVWEWLENQYERLQREMKEVAT